MSGGHHAADAGEGIDVGVLTHNGAGIQHGVAAHLHKVAQDGTDLQQAGGDGIAAVSDGDKGLVGLDVGGDGACAHVGLVAQDAVAHIIIMRNLNAVEEDHILQLHGIAHHASAAHQGGAADKCTVADFGICANDAGCAQIGRGSNLGGLVNPDGGRNFDIIFSQLGAEGQDQLADACQRLPGEFEISQIFAGHGMVQIEKIVG